MHATDERCRVSVINRTGHIEVQWDPSAPDEVARARDEVAHLRAAGYTFFLAGEPVVGEDPVGQADGLLMVERVSNPVEAAEKERARPTPRARRQVVAMAPMGGG